jgi:hypothetical protein
MDPETDRSSLRSHGGDILKAFTDRALKLHDERSAFERAIFGDGSLPEMPMTIIDALWADITFKTSP